MTYEELNKSDTKLVICYAGGGSSFIHGLLMSHGASNTLLEATCTYSREATVNYLEGQEPEKYVSADQARHMAILAFARGINYGADPSTLIGLGITASLSYKDQRKDRVNQAFISVCQNGRIRVYDIILENKQTREDQDMQIASCLEDILDGDLKCCLIEDTASYTKLFSGSFNPLHEGHTTIFESVQNCCYELCINNADKGKISLQDISARVVQFNGKPLVISTAATFKEKDELYKIYRDKGYMFLVGNDTAQRIFNRDSGCDAEFIVFKSKDEVVDKLPINCYISNIEVPNIRSTDLRDKYNDTNL